MDWGQGMITPEYARQMAAYNRWQNRNILTTAHALEPSALEAPRGVFFSSIRRTMSHILWADLMWLHRFSGSDAPDAPFKDSAEFVANWDALALLRPKVDQQLVAWSADLDPAWLQGDIVWTSSVNGAFTRKPAALAVVHLFNHQTHHRGQVHAMLTASGGLTQPTDILFMP